MNYALSCFQKNSLTVYETNNPLSFFGVFDMPKLSYTYKVCLKCGTEYPDRDDLTKCERCSGDLQRMRREVVPLKEWKRDTFKKK